MHRCQTNAKYTGKFSPYLKVKLEFTLDLMRGSRNFRQGGGGGGVQVNLTKKSTDKVFFFFSPQLFFQKSNG